MHPIEVCESAQYLIKYFYSESTMLMEDLSIIFSNLLIGHGERDLLESWLHFRLRGWSHRERERGPTEKWP